MGVCVLPILESSDIYCRHFKELARSLFSLTLSMKVVLMLLVYLLFLLICCPAKGIGCRMNKCVEVSFLLFLLPRVQENFLKTVVIFKKINCALYAHA